MKLIHGDCLEEMGKLIKEGIKVDAIICDPPYGTTECKWDSVIPFDAMWERLNKLIKSNGAIVLFGSQPYTSALICSNIKNFKHELIWDKAVGGAFVLAKKRVLPAHENILLFCNGSNTYNPQMAVKPKKDRRPKRPDSKCTNHSIKTGGGIRKQSNTYKEEEKYPTSILRYPKQMAECNNTKRVHPTQKPVKLMEYLISTYTNENELVLDFTMGSGTTGVACKNTNRDFIGIDNGCCEKEGTYKDWKWVDVVKERLCCI